MTEIKLYEDKLLTWQEALGELALEGTSQKVPDREVYAQGYSYHCVKNSIIYSAVPLLTVDGARHQIIVRSANHNSKTCYVLLENNLLIRQKMLKKHHKIKSFDGPYRALLMSIPR